MSKPMSGESCQCEGCDGNIRMTVAKDGQKRTNQWMVGIYLQIPDNFPVATCDKCGETYFSLDEARNLTEVLKPEFVKFCENLIQTVESEARIERRQLEMALGVAPQYLTRVVNGTERPTLTVIRLLEAFLKYPSLLKRHMSC